MNKVKSKTLKSSHLRCGKRTFVFDVNESANHKKYLKITESQFVEEGKPHLYNSFILFPEQINDFQKYFEESAAVLG